MSSERSIFAKRVAFKYEPAPTFAVEYAENADSDSLSLYTVRLMQWMARVRCCLLTQSCHQASLNTAVTPNTDPEDIYTELTTDHSGIFNEFNLSMDQVRFTSHCPPAATSLHTPFLCLRP